MRSSRARFRVLEGMGPQAPYTQDFTAKQRLRDMAWGLASVRIRDKWVRETALKLCAQSHEEWNHVLTHEWDKVKDELRAQWESGKED